VGEGGTGGAGEEPLAIECAEGYVDWLKGGFGFPDGAVLGTLDSPSFPWRPAAGLTLASGRLTGTGTAVVTQGTTFSYAGTRLRARVRFTDADQEVAFAVNTAADGAGGLRVTVSALGELVLSEGQASRGQASFDPLATGQDYFVEVAVDGADAVATLASGNYAKVGSIVATVATQSLLKSAKGARASVRLDSQSGVSPNVDELSVARCGGAAPSYDALLVDNFQRADSTTLGSPQTPANKSWASSGDSVRIVDGSLEVKGIKSATIAVALPIKGLRLRTAVKMVGGGSNVFMWADVNYNTPSHGHGVSYPGYWVWGPPNDYHYLGIFRGDGYETKYVVPLAASTAYYAELNRDEDVAVLTLRSQSFSGPILSAFFNHGIESENPGSYFTVGDEGGDGTRFDEIRADAFKFE
jgi:hypothetical protein